MAGRCGRLDLWKLLEVRNQDRSEVWVTLTLRVSEVTAVFDADSPLVSFSFNMKH